MAKYQKKKGRVEEDLFPAGDEMRGKEKKRSIPTARLPSEIGSPLGETSAGRLLYDTLRSRKKRGKKKEGVPLHSYNQTIFNERRERNREGGEKR